MPTGFFGGLSIPKNSKSDETVICKAHLFPDFRDPSSDLPALICSAGAFLHIGFCAPSDRQSRAFFWGGCPKRAKNHANYSAQDCADAGKATGEPAFQQRNAMQAFAPLVNAKAMRLRFLGVNLRLSAIRRRAGCGRRTNRCAPVRPRFLADQRPG